MSIPFLLRLVLRTKTEEDTKAVAPSLPLEGDDNGPAFKIKRSVRNRTKKSRIGTSGLELTAKFPVHVDWSRAHLAGNPTGTAASSSTEAAVAGPGHGWTPSVRDAKASFAYSTTALLSGFMVLPLSPSFELPTLRVGYTLRLAFPLDGLRNSFDEQLCIVRATSGVTAQDLASASVDVAEASTRAIGARRASLLQTLNNMQGDAEEVRKLDEMAKVPDYGDGEEGTWTDEKHGKKGAEKQHDLPEYDEAVDGMGKVKLADEKR